MPRLFQKRSGTWSEILSVFQKQGGTWTEILNIFQKIGGTWTKVFAAAKVPGNTVAPTITGSGYLYGTLTNTNLGTWTNTPTSYARQWRRANPPESGGEPSGYSNISGATSSTYVTTSADNGKYVVCQVTATNAVGSNAASSNFIYVSKYEPVSLLPYTFSGSALVGSTLTALEQIGSWKNTTTNSGDTYPDTFEYEWSYTDGTIIQSSTLPIESYPRNINSSSLLIISADLNKQIRVRVTGTNTGGSATSGYTTSGTVTTIYSFSFGNTLYVGSNGYIGLDNGGSVAGTAGNGRNINIWNEDLVQYRLQEYSDNSNYYLYFRAYKYDSPLVRSSINALDYQIKFYTDQPYCDVYLVRKGSSVPTYIDSPGYYSNGLNGFAGIAGPFSWAAGSVLRVYFNGTVASTSAASWTAISNSLWKDITTVDIDDNFTSVVTSANQSFSFTSPSPSSVTYSSGVFTINFTGGSGPFYQGWYQTDALAIGTQPALTGTDASTPDAPASGGSFTSSPLTRSITGSSGYTYYWWVRSALTATGTGTGNVTAWSGPVSVTIPNATMTTAPTYGSATSTSDGFTASINNTPNPSGGTYTVVSNSNANASTAITSGGAVTVTGLAASASNTVTVSYAKFGFTTVQFTVTGTASAANTVPGAVVDLTYTAITGGARISWSAPTSDGGSAITRYEITRNSSNANPPTGWFTNGTSLTYDYTLSAGTYTIYVRAVNSVGNGAASSVSVTVEAPIPSVTSIRGATGGRTGASTWNDPKNTMSYVFANVTSAEARIQRSATDTWTGSSFTNGATQALTISSNAATQSTNQPTGSTSASANFYYRAQIISLNGVTLTSSTTPAGPITSASIRNTQTAKNASDYLLYP
jgi:hypothetical protein